MIAMLENLPGLWEWILRSTLHACVLIAAIRIIQLMLHKRLAPRWVYALWFILLARLLMPWAPESMLSLFNVVPVEVLEPAFSDVGIDAAFVHAPAIPYEAPGLWDRLRAVGVLPIAWLIGAVVLMAHIIYRNVRMRISLRSAPPLTAAHALSQLERCRTEMGIRGAIQPILVDADHSPALFGFLRPCLLMPLGLAESLDAQRLRHVFLHELSHYRRGDVVVNWIMTVLLTLHWFNPLIWYAYYRMRADRELACDALALSYTDPSQSKEYGLTILELMERRMAFRQLPGLVGILEEPSQLKRRMSAIALFRANSYRLTVLALLVLIGMASALLTDARSQETRPADADPPSKSAENAESVAEDVLTLAKAKTETSDAASTERDKPRGDALPEDTADSTETLRHKKAPPQAAGNEAMAHVSEYRVSIFFEDIHLRDILDFISDTYEVNIMLDQRVVPPSGKVPEVIGQGVNDYVTDGIVAQVNFRDVPLLEALKALLLSLDLDFSLQPNHIWISTPERIRKEFPSHNPVASDLSRLREAVLDADRIQEMFSSRRQDELAGARQFELKLRESLQENAIEKVLDAPVSIFFEDIHLREILDFITNTYEINIMLDNRVIAAPGEAPEVIGQGVNDYVTDGIVAHVNLSNITLRQALTAVLRPLNLTFSVQEGFIWISTEKNTQTETFEDLETRHYALSEGQLAAVLRRAYTDQGRPLPTAGKHELDLTDNTIFPYIRGSVSGERMSFVHLDTRTRKLMVHNSPRHFLEIEALLKELRAES